MRVAFLGDVHGETRSLNSIPEDVDRIIQVGDFAFLHNPNRWSIPKMWGKKVEFIDGNHDSIDMLKQASENYTKKAEIIDGLTYIPRGHIEKIGNSVVGFMGGGESIDKHLRTPFVSWFPEESIMAWQTRKMIYNGEHSWGGKLDILVSHVPPIMAAHKLYDYVYPEYSISSMEVQHIVDALRPRVLICGHAHRSLDQVIDDVRVVVLNINQFIIEEL